MKTTLRKITTNHENMLSVLEKKLPLVISHAIAANVITFENELKIKEKQRISLAEQYAEKDENGNPKTEKGSFCFGENLEDFRREYDEYLDAEIDINIRTISFSDIEKCEDGRYDLLTPIDLVNINFMIEN